MNKLFSSPLLLTLIGLNFLAVLVLGIPYLLPLPTALERDQNRGAFAFGTEASTSQTEDYTNALERPIFHTNRRRPVKAVAAPTPVAQARRIEAPFSLVGILGGANNKKTAYLENKNTGETLSVKAGERAGDWTVHSIGQDIVTLILNDERRVIQLAGGG